MPSKFQVFQLETILRWDHTSHVAKSELESEVKITQSVCMACLRMYYDPWVLGKYSDHTHLWTRPSFWSQLHSYKVSWLHLARFWCYRVDKICWQTDDTPDKVLKPAFVVVPATVGVSRATFCHDDTHTDRQTDSQGEYNTSYTITAGKYLKCQWAEVDMLLALVMALPQKIELFELYHDTKKP